MLNLIADTIVVFFFEKRLQLVQQQNKCSPEEARKIVFGPSRDFFEHAFLSEVKDVLEKDSVGTSNKPSGSNAIVQQEKGVVALTDNEVVM